MPTPHCKGLGSRKLDRRCSGRCHKPGHGGVLVDVAAADAGRGARRKDKPMKLAVFGSNGPTGRLLTQLALDEGHDVVGFPRRPDVFPIEHRRLEVVAGDVHDAAAVASAIDGTDAVLSTLGVPFAKSPVTVYSGGVTNIMAGMHAGGGKRLRCGRCRATRPPPEPPPGR